MIRQRPLVPLMTCLNESPSEKEGKLRAATSLMPTACCLNESPSEKEGKYFARHTISTAVEPQ